MKTKLITSVFLFIGFFAFSQTFNYQRSWGTYFGDERFRLKDSAVDQFGNIYIVGIVLGEDQILPNFTTTNALQTNYGGGFCDGFIVKFNPQGQIDWATYYGGILGDGIGGITIDKDNNIFVMGFTQSSNNIASTNASQSVINGESDFLLARFDTNGNRVWGTYYGGDNNEYFGSIYDVLDGFYKNFITNDGANHFYIAGYSFSTGMGTPGTFQQNGVYIISQFDYNGNRTWCTFYGIYGGNIHALKASSSGLYLSGMPNTVQSNTPYNSYYGTPSGFQPSPIANGAQIFFSKFNFQGQREWGTYYGGNFESNIMPKSIATYQDKVYFAGTGTGLNCVTPGTFQNLPSFGNFVTQFNGNGSRNWGTYNGSNQLSGFLGDLRLNTDNLGNIFFSGATNFVDNIATSGSYKNNITGTNDGYVCKFDTTGNKIWGTYYGGELFEENVNSFPYSDKFYIVGETKSMQQIVSSGSYQENLVVSDPFISYYEKRNIFIAHFEPNALNNNTFDKNNLSFFPNPTKGNFTIKGNFNTFYENVSLDIYDQIGRKIATQNVNTSQTEINQTFDFQNKLSKGVYFAKLISVEKVIQTFKIIIE